MLLADREASSLGDPFSRELLTVREQSITGNGLNFRRWNRMFPALA